MRASLGHINRWSFACKNFCRGRPELLAKMIRTTVVKVSGYTIAVSV